MVEVPGMSSADDFERGYFGHGRGVVVTQPSPGVFEERPMTAGELAARAPAWEIGKDPYEFLTQAGAAVYIRAWEVIATAIDAALADKEREIGDRDVQIKLLQRQVAALRRSLEHQDDIGSRTCQCGDLAAAVRQG